MKIDMAHSIDFLHKMNEKVNQFLFVHGLNMMIGNQEADVISRNRLSSQHNEVVGTLGHEVCEFVGENALNLQTISLGHYEQT